MTSSRALRRTRGTVSATRQNREGGYLLITLMLAFALIAIAALAVLPALEQQIQRDREDELRNRGTQYMRAIQRYYRFFGRYPTRVEDLESSNNKRFIRKRYKDPMSKDPQTGKELDFKFLHLQDVMLNNGPVMGASGATGLAQLSGQQGAQSPGLEGWQNALSGNIENPPSTDSSTSEQGSSSDADPISDPAKSGVASNSDENSTLSWQTSGGGPILGVASNSKQKSIHEYNKKNHYNEWYFIYDASAPRSAGVLLGPWQPTLNMTTNLNATNAPSGVQGQPQSGVGTSQNPVSLPNPMSQQNPPGGSPSN